MAPTAEDPAECVTDKGYHSRLVLKALDDGPWKSRISEPKQKGFARWHGDDAARRAVTNNRTRLLSPGKPSSCAPRSSSAPLPTTSIAAVCAGFGAASMHKRYPWLPRCRPQRYVIALIGAGTPKRGRGGRKWRRSCLLRPLEPLVVQIVLIVSEDGDRRAKSVNDAFFNAITRLVPAWGLAPGNSDHKASRSDPPVFLGAFDHSRAVSSTEDPRASSGPKIAAGCWA